MKISNRRYLLIIAVIVLVGTVFWYRGSAAAGTAGLAALKKEKPALASYIDEIAKFIKKKANRREEPARLLSLGLAWKGLADRQTSSIYYREALRTYEQGIKATGRKNTVFLNNAGNMAIYLADYRKARKYYEEAIRVAPADPEGYVRLAGLHRDYLGSPPAAVIGIYDQGLGRIILGAAVLKQAKEEYQNALVEKETEKQ